MRLPDSVYNEVLRGLGLQTAGIAGGMSACAAGEADPYTAPSPAEAPAECKRRSRRRRLNRPVQFLRHGAVNAKPQTCTLLDVSRDGLCVLMDAVVAPGDRFVLYLPRVDDDCSTAEPLAILCTARSSRLKAGGQFRTGAEFTDAREAADGGPTPAVTAERLVRPKEAVRDVNPWIRAAGRPDAEPDANARRADRQEADGRAMIYLYRDDGRHGPMEQVALRDYSEKGVGIVRGEPLEIGEQFVVRVPRLNDKPITRLCRVVNVALAGGRHRIGAEFIPFPGPNGRTLMSRIASWIG